MIKRIKGTQDILPEATPQWIALENLIRKTMTLYNFHELRTPIFEQTQLFARGIGQLTDIVSKEMYTFLDRGKKQLTLKPEMTAPIMRAYIENKLYARAPVNKVFYIAPLFRQENPQAGRLRQFHQFGAETLGSADPLADVEIIDLAMSTFQLVGLKNINLRINSVGDPQCRAPYKETLKEYMRPHLAEYCEDCQRRYEENPLRVLDCKNPTCQQLNQQAPKLNEHLCEACDAHYARVKETLKLLEIPFTEDPYLVRGLDYYTRTVFEITSDVLGAQNAICGGGRYDLLASELEGPDTPAVGFAAGMERLLIAMEQEGIVLQEPPRLDVFIVALGDQAKSQAPRWLKQIRLSGLSAETDLLGRSIKAQMREANRQRARFVLLVGEDELQRKEFSVKLMDRGEQISVPFDEIVDFLKRQTKQD
ncbi:Histidyl-tRNA synthetase [Caldithrix abyssi DSM 13497]|uniref:Histidine--tRNA ligase n=1 Tax=Caldithrix abyssi DSM 13497 TaxID=880073 RepID=H1XRT5_CALAY|nr:histidine--tRNA ligase [Caldithrix abyssi]APF17156.1 hisS histidyl-tRNA synthetase [Caldithrix abyssi DSM 13497]EHO41295.1 Histidyl-tRNA synthetase [Caldithrix abyssi DSM 13497]